MPKMGIICCVSLPSLYLCGFCKPIFENYHTFECTHGTHVCVLKVKAALLHKLQNVLNHYLKNINSEVE